MTSVHLFLLQLVAVSVDCPTLLNFASSLNIPAKNASLWTALSLPNDCCTAQGITCSGGKVTEIYWSSMSPALDGTIDKASIPPVLVKLQLGYNSLTGTIPNIFPTTLQVLVLSQNLLSGSVPTYPPGLTLIDVSNNQLNGTIPSPFPSTLQTAYFHNNKFLGSIPSPLPSGLLLMYVYGNSMLGDIPALPTSLQELGIGWPAMYGNHFTGSVVFQKPVRLYLNNNYISNIVVNDSSAITGCDLSGTALLGNPNLGNLAACIKTGLYSANSLPNTISPKISAGKSITNLPHTSVSILVTSNSLWTSSIFSFKTNSNNLFTKMITITSATTSSILTKMVSITGTTDSSILTKYLPISSSDDKNSFNAATFLRSYSTLIQSTIGNALNVTVSIKGKDASLSLSLTVFNVSKLLINTLLLASIATKTPWMRKTHISQSV